MAEAAAAADGDHMAGATTGAPPGSQVLVLDEFVLESGVALSPCPVAYTTYGALSPEADNVVVVGHSLTSNSNVHEWWSAMMGDGADWAIDLTNSFVLCVNYLGSPYGTCSPITNPETKPFPICTVRDNVRLQRAVFDRLKCRKVKLCIGGSMGAMVCAEWACTYPDVVCGDVVLIAGCGRHTAWAIALSEAQRFAIRGDAVTGLAAARMMAMLAYRAPSSIDDKFSRRAAALLRSSESTPREGSSPSTPSKSNDGSGAVPSSVTLLSILNGSFSADKSLRRIRSDQEISLPPMCSAAYDVESYLHYQSLKFVRRFDPECYVSLTLTMDTHDIGRARNQQISPSGPAAANGAAAPHDEAYDGAAGDASYYSSLATMAQRTLVVGISSDVLYPIALQEELAAHIPNARLYTIDSHHGHDSFLIEIDGLNAEVASFVATGNGLQGTLDSATLRARRQSKLKSRLASLQEESAAVAAEMASLASLGSHV